MDHTKKQSRSSFTGKIGFILAAAGSAVGLGNIWRFPYLAAQYGGGIFLLVYLILAVTFGFTLMITEIALGRKTGLSAAGAFSKLDKRFSFLGKLSSLVPMIIFPYYSVIGGWVTKYCADFITGRSSQAAGENYFNQFITQPVEPVIWLCLFIFATAAVVLFGVEGGIEKVSRLLMPILVILSMVIAVYTITQPGAWEGVKYYLMPDFSRFSGTTVLAALGQLFYSMSLAMGIMITYGSYMKREVDFEHSVGMIELFDTGIAFLAGLMIVPSVFVFSGGDEAALGKGPGLMFDTLPKVFDRMPAGGLIGALFFILVLFAALTSAISLMETVVSIFQDRFHWSRKVTCLAVMAGAILVAVPSSLGFGVWSPVTLLGKSILDFFDFISNSVIMPVVALLTCIFVAFFAGSRSIVEEVELSSKFRRKKMYLIMIRYIAPICIIAILITSILEAFSIIKI